MRRPRPRRRRKSGEKTDCENLFEKDELMTTYEQDRRAAIQAATEYLQNCVILDSETTGLVEAEIVQIAVIDHTGAVLLDTLVNPPHPERVLQKSSKGICAADIHHLTPDKLEGAPSWPEVWPKLAEVIRGRKVVIYNADFDWPIVRAMCAHYGIEDPMPEPLTVDCAMELYAVFVGDWNEYRKSYTWKRLPHGDHSALGDCQATLLVLKTMAASREETSGTA